GRWDFRVDPATTRCNSRSPTLGSRVAALYAPGPIAKGEDNVRACDRRGARACGYWSDCANTVVFCRQPDAEQRRYLDSSRAACEAAIAGLQPGARCTEPVD